MNGRPSARRSRLRTRPGAATRGSAVCSPSGVERPAALRARAPQRVEVRGGSGQVQEGRRRRCPAPGSGCRSATRFDQQVEAPRSLRCRAPIDVGKREDRVDRRSPDRRRPRRSRCRRPCPGRVAASPTGSAQSTPGSARRRARIGSARSTRAAQRNARDRAPKRREAPRRSAGSTVVVEAGHATGASARRPPPTRSAHRRGAERRRAAAASCSSVTAPDSYSQRRSAGRSAMADSSEHPGARVVHVAGAVAGFPDRRRRRVRRAAGRDRRPTRCAVRARQRGARRATAASARSPRIGASEASCRSVR